jgi:hypothetical protein
MKLRILVLCTGAILCISAGVQNLKTNSEPGDGIAVRLRSGTTSLLSSTPQTVSLAVSYTLTTGDTIGTLLVTTGSSNRTITLPAANASTNRKIFVKKVDSGTGEVIIATAGSDQIDASYASTFLVSQGAFLELTCDGTGWYATRAWDYASTNVARGSAVLVNNASNAQITTLSLPAGQWVFNSIFCFLGSPTTTNGDIEISITTSSGSVGTRGLNDLQLPSATQPISQSDSCYALTGYKVAPSSTTTYYMNESYNGNSAQTVSGYGTIAAERRM